MSDDPLSHRLRSRDYHVRKQARREQYAKTHGVKSITCTACSGSGRYDHNGSPPCSLCQGTGKFNRIAEENQ